MYIAIGVVLAAIFLCIIAVKLFFAKEGTEEIVVKLAERTPFEVTAQDEKSVTLVTKLEFANVGKHIGTIMDALVRPLVPYEQDDGLAVRGRAEREGAPREAYSAKGHEHQGGNRAHGRFLGGSHLPGDGQASVEVLEGDDSRACGGGRRARRRDFGGRLRRGEHERESRDSARSHAHSDGQG